jgi:hypothetical protein
MLISVTLRNPSRQRQIENVPCPEMLGHDNVLARHAPVFSSVSGVNPIRHVSLPLLLEKGQRISLCIRQSLAACYSCLGLNPDACIEY